jgi:hypothetical protein
MGAAQINQFLTHQAVEGIHTVQELLGHADVATTMIYTHVLNKGVWEYPAPLTDCWATRRAHPVSVSARRLGRKRGKTADYENVLACAGAFPGAS